MEVEGQSLADRSPWECCAVNSPEHPEASLRDLSKTQQFYKNSLIWQLLSTNVNFCGIHAIIIA